MIFFAKTTSIPDVFEMFAHEDDLCIDQMFFFVVIIISFQFTSQISEKYSIVKDLIMYECILRFAKLLLIRF